MRIELLFLSFMMIETLRVLKVSAPRAAIKQKFHGMLRTYGSPGVTRGAGCGVFPNHGAGHT